MTANFCIIKRMQKIINFTGMDGSGKTTALHKFATIMRNRGFTVLDVSSTYFNNSIYDLVASFENETRADDHLLERYIHTVDLHMLLKDLIKADVSHFDYILFDRHFIDKRIFFELRTGKEWPIFFEKLVAGPYYPEINLYFKIDPKNAFLRLSRKRILLDWKESLEVLQRSPDVYEKYLGRDTASRVDIDANLSENLVLNQIMTNLTGINFE
jgi:thymidylate kinase